MAATAAAAAEITAVEAARNGIKVTPAALAAAAARRRDSSPLVFSGDVDVPPDAALLRSLSARPETNSTSSGSGSGGSSEARCGGRGQGSCGSRSGAGDGRRGGSRQSRCESSLQKREQRLNEREAALRRREDAMAVASVAGDANTTGMLTEPRPPRRERDRPASATALRRHGGNRQQEEKIRPGSQPASSPAGGSNDGRPKCARSSRDSLETSRAKKEEAALIARCRALGTARRKAATEATRRRESLEKAPTRPEPEANRQRSGDTPTTAVARPGVDDAAADTTAAVGTAATAVAARAPSRPQSAVATRRPGPGGCPRPTIRPRSASTSRSNDGRGDGARAGHWGVTRGGGTTGSEKVRGGGLFASVGRRAAT